MRRFSPLFLLAMLTSTVLSHPGHDIRQEMRERATFFETNKRDLSHCAAQMNSRGIEQATIQRRAAVAKEARKKRGLDEHAPSIEARDAGTVINTSHLSSINYTEDTDESVIFSGNNSCVLSPEVTEGPYYVNGEFVRENVIENQEGVELILDAQIIDMATCDPVADVMLEIWHCNSTGVYSGIVASGNGVGATDPANINSTFLRGLQSSDDLGVAQFTTLFPGHYTGRTTHIHILAHFNGTTFDNGTYSGGYVSHVGQLFFDQDLISAVETNAPYSSNKQDLTTNEEDMIFSQEAATSDPVVEYSLLGDTVEAGIFGWITFGVDLTEIYTVSAASDLTASGGVANDNSGGSGGSPPSGFPGGASAA